MNEPREELFCKYCHKQCKNLNSLKQHELRCKLNPDRKSFNSLSSYIQKEVKGKTKETSASIAKQVQTVRNKYAAGYVNPNKGKRIVVEHIYADHNNAEIQKWLNYLDSIQVEIPKYETIMHNQGYKVISKMQSYINRTVCLMFEHDYLANLLLNGQLKDFNTVHHIDMNRANNQLKNLLVFIDKASHKRFHGSAKAYLIYDDNAHLFDCIIK
mgnify:CR=1 FL=1